MKAHTKPASFVSSSFRSLALASALLLPAATALHAATDTWSGSVNGVWDISTLNWNGGASAFTSANDALFTGTPANNVTNATGLTIGAITLDGTFTGSVELTGANTVTNATTISAGTLSLRNVAGAGASAITVNSGGTNWLNAGNVTYTNTISGAGVVRVTTGNGDVTLLNNIGSLSGFTGTLELNQSVLGASKTRFTTSQANLPSPSATIKVGTNTTLYLNQTLLYGSTIQLSGPGNTENLGALRLEANANITNSLVLLSNSFIGVNGSAATISGVISESGGSFGFTKQGNNTLTNSGANTYSGKTFINGGTVAVSSLNSVVGGSASSGLGAPTTAANGTINIGTGTTTGSTLNYLGAGEITDRILNLAGTTAGSTINNNGTGLLKFTSDVNATGLGNKSIALGGSTGDGEISGSISNSTGFSTGLAKNNGTNTWTLSAATNYFTGQLQVSAGTLVWSTAGALAPSAGNFLPLNITGGGRLIVNGPLRYSSGSAGVNGYLNLGNNAVGGIGTILINAGGSLTFTNQTGNPNSIVGQQGTAGVSKLIVNGGTFNWDGSGGLIVGNSGGSGLLLITNDGTATILKGTATPEEGLIMLGRDSNTSTGEVSLVTGTLATGRAFVRDGSSGAGSGVANFNFDGGKLQALASQTDWLQSSTSGNNLALTAVTIMDGGATIDANGFAVAINNDLLHGGVAATDGGVTKLGLGTLTLGGLGHTFTGPTVVSNGTLAVTGSLPSGSPVTVAGGMLTVAGSVGGAVAVQPGGAIGASSGTFSSLVTLAAGNAAINLQDGAATTTTFANGLTLDNGNVLSFDLGATSDQISVPGTFTHSGTATINLAAVSGITEAVAYTLISDAANDITTTNGFILGTVPNGYTAVLDASSGYLTVTLTQNVPGTAYWKGDVDNQWNSLTGGNNSNWATDSTGATDTGALPSTPSAVIFAATGAGNLNTILGANFTINNLTLSTANNVTIGGSTNALTLIAGLLNDTTALNNTISVSNVVLGSSQTWQNNSANPLTVSSMISGASDLAIGGTGTIVLANTNNSFASTTIGSGTLQLGDGSASNGAVAGGITNNSILTFANPAAQSFSGAISGTGQLVKTGAGTLTLPADNTYAGSTTISNGSLVIVTNGASTGTVDVNSGASFVCRPTTTTTYPNTVTGTGLVKLLFGDEGLGYNNTGDWFTYLDNLGGFNGTVQLSATTITNVNKWAAGAATVSGTSALIIDVGAQLYMNGNSLTFSTIQVNGAGNYQNRGAVRAQAGTLTGAMSLLGDTTFGTEGGTIAGTIASGTAGTQTLTFGGTADSGGNITVSADIGGGTGAIALNKIGTGATTLSGVNTHTGTSTVGGGTLTLANGSALQNSTLALTAGSLVFDSAVSSNEFTFGGLTGTAGIGLTNTASSAITLSVGNNNSTTTYNGALSDAGLGGALKKLGTGTLTLGGANSYAGATTVSGGKLVISSVHTNATTGIAVDDGAALTINVAGANQLAPSAYTLGSSSGPTTNEFVGLSSTTTAPVNGGSLTVNGTARINIIGGTFAAGNAYPLIKFTSLGGAGGFALGTLPNGVTANLVTNGGNTIALNVTAYVPFVDVWTGAVNTNWDIATTTNWNVNGSPGVYSDGDVARFDDTAAQTNVFVTTTVAPSSTIVSNVTATYTFTGSAIGGGGGLTKQGASTLVLAQANTYNGNTVISDGTVRLGVANAIPGGAGKGDVALASTLDLNANSVTINGLSGAGTVDTVAGGTPTLTIGASGSSATFDGVIQNTAGTLALAKGGSGTATLNGNNSYAGATTVSAGTLKLGSGTALGAVGGITTIANSAALELNGQSISEPITMASGASVLNNSNATAVVSADISTAGAALAYFGGTGDMTLQRVNRTSGAGQVEMLWGGSGTLDLIGATDNGFVTLSVTNGTVLLDKASNEGGGIRAASMLNLTNGTVKLAGTGDGQLYDGNPLTIAGGVFDMNSHNEGVGTLVGTGGVILNNSNATTGTLTIGGVNAPGGDFYGAIQDGTGKVALTKVGTGALQTLQGTNTYTGNTLINGGTLSLVGEGSINNTPLIQIASGATLSAASRNDGTLTLQSGQTLAGNGSVSGTVTNLAGSTVSPGTSIGTLTFNNDLALGGKLFMELDRTNAQTCDTIVVSGTTTYGGTLTVTNIGQALQQGDTFQLFSAAASGFGTVNLPVTDASGTTYTWTNNVAVDGSISVATATSVNTNPTNITFSASGGNLTLSWPADHTGWTLQVQTNTRSVGLSTNWFNVSGSATTNQVVIPVGTANGTVFYRMVYP